MKQLSYAEKLKDPRWLELRKQVIERDKNICQLCYEEGVLQVHHAWGYRAGLEPWEYDINELITLCPNCHEKISDGVKRATELVWEMAQNVNQIQALVTLLEEIKLTTPLQRDKISAMVFSFTDYCRYYNKNNDGTTD